jgi:GxxExxY protein
MLNRVPSTLSPEVEALIFRTIGCALEVHKALGAGFLEPIYHKAMRIELKHQGLGFQSEHLVDTSYRGEVLQGHRIDLIVENSIIVELKAVAKLGAIHQSQLVSYLRATQLRAGLLINFNTDWLKSSIKRVVI